MNDTMRRPRLPFTVIAKPTGAACNLDCQYCFFLSKELLYDSARQMMSEEVLESYIRQFLAASPDDEVTMLWQGGEPTLRGIDFFRTAVSLCERYRRKKQLVKHALQTNSTLIDDEWIAHDVGRVFVQDFDGALGSLFGQYAVCVHAPECGYNFALEFNGDVYACDHWVEPDWLIGNVANADFFTLSQSARMKRFGLKKHAELTDQCRRCPYVRMCNGGCPKDRFLKSKDGQNGQNYLCAGYSLFYEHIRPDIIGMARLIRSGHAASEIMDPRIRSRVRVGGALP